MVKVMKVEGSQYLIELFKIIIYRTFSMLRNLENRLYLQKPKTECFKDSISYSGTVLWNSLSVETIAIVMTPLE